MFAKIGVPSFVVTFADLLAWQGMLLVVLGNTATVNSLSFSVGRLVV